MVRFLYASLNYFSASMVRFLYKENKGILNKGLIQGGIKSFNLINPLLRNPY